MPAELNATHYIERLEAHQSDEELRKIQRYFKSGPGDYGEGDLFMGVRMGQVFELSKEFIAMPPSEIEKLLESPIHEVRAGGMSIMSKQFAHKKTPESRKKELFDLYLRRHDRINNWDLVDLAGHVVVGGYLIDKPRDILYKLARSENMWERRTAIFATMHFVMKADDLEDAYALAELLLYDDQDLIHKTVGWVLRVAGTKDRQRLLTFLDQHAATMPRMILRNAIELFDKEDRAHYLGMKKAG